MATITLTTDWAKGDYYLPSVLGLVQTKAPNTVVTPISTEIEQHNVSQAAFIFKSTYMNFPDGTIHIIGVDYVSGNEKKFLVASINEHYFLCPDNGIFSLLFEDVPQPIYEIDKSKFEHPKRDIFPELHILTNAACELLNGKNIDDLAFPVKEITRKVDFIPTIDDDVIIGKVIYIDSYLNAITNISIDLFKHIGKNRTFTIYVKSKRDKITEISDSYNEASGGDLIALFNSADLLELAMVNAGAAQLFNLDTNSTIRINFHEEKDANELHFMQQ